jgi:asparagine synthase (glutamine-hydrolysing)
LVAQLAREAVTVALSGDGGDELFGGYTRYQDALLRGIADAGAIDKLLAALGLMVPHLFPGKNYLINRGRDRWGRYASLVVQPVRTDEGGIGNSAQPGGTLSVADQLRTRIPMDLSDDFAAAIMQIDLQNYLPGDILTKVDRTTMAVSLEARVPLLDFDLVDYALQVPGSSRVTATHSKRLFRRAIRGIVPDSVLERPKQGFEIPLGKWFRGPLRHRIEALRNPSAELQLYVDGKAVERLISEHLIGRRDHSATLWRLTMLQGWLSALRRGSLALPPSVPKRGIL